MMIAKKYFCKFYFLFLILYLYLFIVKKENICILENEWRRTRRVWVQEAENIIKDKCF